ncbi:MAG: efflux RND transporter permease subunit [Fimbriimonadaceae bacterium]
MGLTKTAITRPVFILMLMVAAIMMGWIAYNSMRVELNPDVNFGVVTVSTAYPGAGPDEINSLISKKIEDAVTGIANVREVTSSSQEGVSIVVVNFEIGSNMDVGLNDVRSKVDAVLGDLPRESLRPVVDKLDTSSDPVITLALKSKGLSNRQLRDLADNVLKDRLARAKGVAAVSVLGGEEREIQVQLKRDALLRYGIGVADVQRAVISGALNVPAGRLLSGDEEFTVRVLGEFDSVEALSDLYLTISDPQQRAPSKQVRLGDVASVIDANKERRQTSRVDGSDSVVMIIQKSQQGNSVEISKAIARPSDLYKDSEGKSISLLDQLGKQYGVDFTITQDTSKTIEESLLDLNIAIFFGIFLVGAVIWVFLHNFRGTLIVSIAIPVCLFATLIALWIFGFTINNLSMLALSLAIGVLVDDSIVVIENVYRHLKMGENPVEAAINGRAEIGLAAIAITLADVVVFLPIGFMGGIVGQFFRPLGIGYAIAVMFSLFVSFTVTPMLAARWYRQGENWEEPEGRFAKWFEHSFERFANGYRKLLRVSLHNKWYFFGGGFAVLVATFNFIGGGFAPTPEAALGTAKNIVPMVAMIGVLIFVGNLIVTRKPRFSIFLGVLGFAALFVAAPLVGQAFGAWKKEAVFKFQFAPSSDGGQVQLNVELPAGSSLEKTQLAVSEVEKVVMAHPQVEFTVTRLGQQGGGGFGAGVSGTQYAQITATLREKEALLDKMMPWVKHEGKQRPMNVTSDAVVSDLIQEVGRVPGVKVNITAAGGFGFGAAIQLALKSNNRELLQSTATKIRDGLAAGAIKGVISPEMSSKPGKPELRAVPDRPRMAAANVSVQDLGATLRALYEGDDTAKFRVDGQEYDIRVMLDLADRNNPELLSTVPVTFREGNPIFLDEVATIQRGKSLDKIERRDREEVIQVNAELLPGFAAGSVQGEIDAWLVKEKMLPEGVSVRALGQADAQQRETVYLFGALGLGLVLVYMILASLFNNLLYPFIIQLAQPQAMVGALLALVLTDKALNIVGFIGIIALVGLVGKNAILLVDYANTLRERGVDRFEALVESGGTRIRPIMMTTVALIAGMLPVALAIGRGSEFRETIGITIIGGTLLSTFLTLLVIPCSYLIFDEFSDRLGRLVNRITKRAPAKVEIPDSPTVPDDEV